MPIKGMNNLRPDHTAHGQAAMHSDTERPAAFIFSRNGKSSLGTSGIKKREKLILSFFPMKILFLCNKERSRKSEYDCTVFLHRIDVF